MRSRRITVSYELYVRSYAVPKLERRLGPERGEKQETRKLAA